MGLVLLSVGRHVASCCSVESASSSPVSHKHSAHSPPCLQVTGSVVTRSLSHASSRSSCSVEVLSVAVCADAASSDI